MVIDIAHYPPFAPKTNCHGQAADTHEQEDNAHFFRNDIPENRKHKEAAHKDEQYAAKNTFRTLASNTTSASALTH